MRPSSLLPGLAGCALLLLAGGAVRRLASTTGTDALGTLRVEEGRQPGPAAAPSSLATPPPAAVDIPRVTFQHGYVPRRGYLHVPVGVDPQHEACMPEQRLAESDLGCEPLSGGRAFLSVAPDPDGKNVTLCGDIPLVPGACALPSRGQYVYLRPNTATPPPDEAVLLPICGLGQEDMSTGRWDPVEQEYSPPPSCRLEDPTPQWLVRHFGGRLIMVIGDSHARNQFGALVSLIRNTRTFSERHPTQESKAKYQPAYRLVVYADRDELFFGPSSKFMDRKAVRGECDAVSLCVVIMYVWAATPAEYQKQFSSQEGTVVSLQPDVILTDFVSATYAGNTPEDVWVNLYQGMNAYFKAHFATTGRPIPLVTAPFIWGGSKSIDPRPVTRLKTWYAATGVDPSVNTTVLLHVVDHDALVKAARRDGIPLAQFSGTWHTVCSWYDNFDMDAPLQGALRLTALEPCTAVSEKAAMVHMLNLATLHEGTAVNV